IATKDCGVRDERNAVLAEQPGRFERNESARGASPDGRGRSNGAGLNEVPFQHHAGPPDDTPCLAREPGNGIRQILRGRPGGASRPFDAIADRQDCAHRTLGDADTQHCAATHHILLRTTASRSWRGTATTSIVACAARPFTQPCAVTTSCPVLNVAILARS